jgi:putative SOS response-associated peptidase YedK
MCGRFTLTVERLEQVAESLQAFVDEQWLQTYRPRYNVAPGNRHWVLRSGAARREIVPAFWGLVNSWAEDPAVGFRQINARAETLATRPAWRSAFKHRRCVVPADGFYEWHGPKKERRPLWFHAPDRALLLLAGLYEDWSSPSTGEVRTTFTIITTPAAEPVVRIHDRMPALLEPEVVDAWLGGSEPSRQLRRARPAELVAAPASRRVNSPAHDDALCLEPDAEPPEPERQRKLF